LSTAKQYFEQIGLRFVSGPYIPEQYFSAIGSDVTKPARCEHCYELRLSATAAAAAELAAYLARRMGRWGAEHLGVVPGWREDLRYWSVHSGLDHGLRVAMAATLERTLGPVWLPEEAAFWERAYHEVLPAVVRDVLGGRKPPPDFAYWLVTHLRQLRD
jgi:hypothetical protein